MLIALCVALLLPVLAKAEPVRVSGVVYPDFTRIVFNAAGTHNFQASLSGSNLELVFVSPIEANFRDMLRALNKQVASASLDDGGKRVRIKLKNADVRLRKFRGQSFFGVDLVPQKKQEEKADVEAKQKAKAAEEKQKKQAQENKKAAAELKAKSQAEAKKKQEAKSKEKIKKVEEAKKKPEPKPKKEETKKPLENTKVAQTPVIKPEVRTIIQKPEKVTRVMPTQATRIIEIPWDKTVSAAIYVRGGNLWLVFDKPAKAELNNLPLQLIAKAEQLENRYNTILKLRLQPDLLKNTDLIWANREQNNWVVYYGKSPSQKLIPFSTPEERNANEMHLAVRHSAEPLQMEDPDIGDLLYVVPVRDPSNRVLEGRKFVELEILPTIQGVVLLRKSDTPTFAINREGIRITSPNTLLTSSQVKPAETSLAKSELEKNTMFPFAHQTDANTFMPTYYQYLKELQTQPEKNRSELLLKMAQHYFLNGFYSESLGLLREILIDDPEFAAKASIKPMIAGNLFMMGRYDQSADTLLNIIENKYSPDYLQEQKLWYWASLKMMDQQYMIPFKPIEGFDVDAALNAHLPSYPYPLRRKLLMIQIQDLVAEARVGVARSRVKEMLAMNPTPEESEMLDLMEAKSLLAEKKDDVGLERLDGILKNAKNGRVRVLALLESTRIAKESGKETLPDIIKRLENGRLDWRGDNAEFALLRTLGQYYIENKQYTEGLRVWRDLLTQFSGTTESLTVAGDMANQFAALFDKNGAAYELPPLQTLGLFFEFNELTPVGERGDFMSRNLADYLTSVDLLDNAAAILTHQVRFRSQGEDRAQLAAKLVDLHLSNSRPDLAQEVINAMAKEKIPDDLKERFQLLNAEILTQQGKYPEALKILEQNKNKAATDMQLAIFWKQQEWEKVISILEPEVKARAENKDRLKDFEEENALRLAIAYSKLRRFEDLKWVRTAYNDRIKKPEIDDALDFVTDSKTTIDHQALEASLEMDKVTSFMGKYRLPEPPPPPPAPVVEQPSPNPLPEGEGKEKPEEEKKPEDKKVEEEKKE